MQIGYRRLMEPDGSFITNVPKSKIQNPKSVLACLAVLCAAAVGFANLRHTGSLAFPIDDGYIYSNYVHNAAQGSPFTYNLGEVSGGITSLGWYILCVLSYWLLAPFHALLGGIAPLAVQETNQQLAQQAGHLYLAAYLSGVLCLAVTAWGVYRLAELAIPPSEKRPVARSTLCWLLGAVAAADLGLVWGAMSGLEVALSGALAVWAVALLVAEARTGALRWSLLLAALLPWARPDLLAIGFAAFLWLLIRAITNPQAVFRIPYSVFRTPLLYLLALVVGLVVLSAVYLVGWGKPLPSSFYAKVGGLRLGSKLFSAPQELLLAGRYLPFVVGIAALAGGLFQWLLPAHDKERRETSLTALLLLLVTALYTFALMLTLPWFGQEDRYLLPLHPFLIVLVGLLLWRLVQVLPLERLVSNPILLRAGAAVVMLILVGANYIWATRDYAVEVRNIRDAHITPALWLAANTAPGSIVASEPIGAVKLFSGRRTIDLVGLTTSATLGTYRDWPRAWEALRKAGANYLFYYPDWFDDGKPPPWVVERRRFEVPDNRIAGSNVIAVYELRWERYIPPIP